MGISSSLSCLCSTANHSTRPRLRHPPQLSGFRGRDQSSAGGDVVSASLRRLAVQLRVGLIPGMSTSANSNPRLKEGFSTQLGLIDSAV